MRGLDPTRRCPWASLERPSPSPPDGSQNLILLGGIGLPATGMLGAYAYFFVPKS